MTDHGSDVVRLGMIDTVVMARDGNDTRPTVMMLWVGDEDDRHGSDVVGLAGNDRHSSYNEGWE
jgi:hypothetical protein